MQPFLVYCIACGVGIIFVYLELRSPLRAAPGPVWARLSRLWYFNRVWNGQFHLENVELHQKYGSVVRLSPNSYSISGRVALKKIYAPGSKFAKSDWYDGWRHPDPNQASLFADKDIKRHNENRKLFTSLYSMSTIVNYEKYVDECVEILGKRLTEASQNGQDIDLGYWMQCYAFDVIAAITYGQRMGFLDRGDDIGGAIAAVGSIPEYSSLVGIFPELHPVLYHIMAKLGGSGAAGRQFVRKFATNSIDRHKEQFKTSDAHQAAPDKQESFMTKLLRAQQEKPAKITDFYLFQMAQSNIIAGFDTTAISLTACLYYLIENPRCLGKLRDEFDSLYKDNTRETAITFQETQRLQYFQAVIKEALRMHPATGLPLWRVVPEGGAEFNDLFFPAGTVVGCNTWVAHYDSKVFTDPTMFRPERWLDSDGDTLKEMNDTFMPFGLGSRTCIGRNISMLEISKVIPILIRDFDFELRSTMNTSNYWFVKPHELTSRLRERTSKPQV